MCDKSDTCNCNICNASDKFNKSGNILISDQFNNRVIEINQRGDIVWFYGLGPADFTADSIIGVNDAQRIGSKTLMAGSGIPANSVPVSSSPNPDPIVDNRVILVDKHKKIIWQYGQFGQTGNGSNLLNAPVQCTYIPKKHSENYNNHHSRALHGGTVLITDQGNNRIIQVNEDKRIIRSYTASSTLSSPNSAEKLDNGNVLIADENNNRAIEVDKNDVIKKTFTANGTLGACAFASRLHNGNTLLTDAGNNRIVEVDENDKIVWQYVIQLQINALPVTRGLRLRNGNTIITTQFNNNVIIVNRENAIVGYYGLPVTGSFQSSYYFGTNNGYDVRTSQLGMLAPYDAKVIGDYTGITKP